MNLDRFKSAFSVTRMNERPSYSQVGRQIIPELALVIDELGGQTFNHGLYRVFGSDQLDAVREAMESVFPEYRGRIIPFAFDWLGRHFAIDLGRAQNGKPMLLMLEVGAGEAMEIPASVLDFHNTELVEYSDDALATLFWHQWRVLDSTDLAFSDCVGYKVPLFLGGSDTVANIEVVNLSVYVEICGQLRHKIRSLEPGQSIRSVTFAK